MALIRGLFISVGQAVFWQCDTLSCVYSSWASALCPLLAWSNAAWPSVPGWAGNKGNPSLLYYEQRSGSSWHIEVPARSILSPISHNIQLRWAARDHLLFWRSHILRLNRNRGQWTTGHFTLVILLSICLSDYMYAKSCMPQIDLAIDNNIDFSFYILFSEERHITNTYLYLWKLLICSGLL